MERGGLFRSKRSKGTLCTSIHVGHRRGSLLIGKLLMCFHTFSFYLINCFINSSFCSSDKNPCNIRYFIFFTLCKFKRPAYQNCDDWDYKIDRYSQHCFEMFVQSTTPLNSYISGSPYPPKTNEAQGGIY